MNGHHFHTKYRKYSYDVVLTLSAHETFKSSVIQKTQEEYDMRYGVSGLREACAKDSDHSKPSVEYYNCLTNQELLVID